jgi:hypothetical protein
MASKTRKILGALSLFGMMSSILRATGQESIYSADSLMATFENGSRVSLKGTQITFRDVVVESEDAKATFKSSRNKRVICKLVASTGNPNKRPLVGSEITVIGKIRGRGLLGNVTLDNCSVAPVVDSQGSANLQQDIASAPADAVSEEGIETPAPPAQSEEVRNDFAPIPSGRPSKPGKGRPLEHAAPSPRLEQQDQTTRRSSDSTRDVPYRFYILLVISGAVGYSILSKLVSSTVPAMRSSRYPESANAEEVRKAALEALLLKSAKKVKSAKPGAHP